MHTIEYRLGILLYSISVVFISSNIAERRQIIKIIIYDYVVMIFVFFRVCFCFVFWVYFKGHN